VAVFIPPYPPIHISSRVSVPGPSLLAQEAATMIAAAGSAHETGCRAGGSSFPVAAGTATLMVE
jgi:hypothetical protein